MSTDAPTTPTSTLAAAALPADLSACHALIRQLLEAQQQSVRTIARLENHLQQLLRRVYGRSAEKLDANQLALFEKMLADLAAPTACPELAPAATAPAPKPNGHGRRRLAADLPRSRVVIDLPEDQKPCPCCGNPRKCIGEEVTEKLDWEPAKVLVIEEVRLKYGCRDCEQAAAEGGPQIVTADKPLSAIEKGLAAPGLLAHVIVSKYCDHLPLHRLERILERHGIDIARSTMCDWAAQSAEALRPIYDLMVQEVLRSRVIHTDDTPVGVLDKEKPGTTKTGRFWAYLGDLRNPSTVFTYTASRSRDGPMEFLKDWGKDGRVYLQADAFGGYDGIYRGEAGGQVTEVACWAHARRKVYEARTTDAAVSTQALAYIRLLYDVEDRARAAFNAQPSEGEGARSLAAIRVALRQEQAVPRLRQFRGWLESQRVERGGSVLPKSPMGQAITYVLNQWEALVVYTTDGELAIDNNASENALRRVAVGRKNWLFCGSDAGGRTAAVLFSLIATCQRHHVNPFDYLRDVLTRIAAHPMRDLAQLLPNRWQTPAVPAAAPA
jgi:transposase